jgi:sphinganine-1-phosphate aldolase
MTLDLFNGDQDTCGITTNGGTESIVLAILAYREEGRRKGIKNPNIVISQTAHAAFDKACFYLKVELRKIPLVNRFDCNVVGMKKAVDANTVCIVASAPDYGFGLFDPVPLISQIA